MLFIINNFGENHGILYVLKILNRKFVFNTHHGQLMHILPKNKYLCPIDEELLIVIRNLSFRKTKDWNSIII